MASTVMSKKLRVATSQKKDASLILDCFRGVMALQPYWNKWIFLDMYELTLSIAATICLMI
jgi:hypothetical protein